MPGSAILTIGHSTRPLDEFISLLRAHGVVQLADVRTVPKSRRHPHFAADALAHTLPAAGIAYRHFPRLGGLRKPKRDSINSAWQHEGFRGYADYMQTAVFEEAVSELVAWAAIDRSASSPPGRAAALQGQPYTGQGLTSMSPVPSVVSETGPKTTAIMCAEAVWWRCHRQLIADALVARGIEVRHIASQSAPPLHRLTEFARVDAVGRVTYPGLV